MTALLNTCSGIGGCVYSMGWNSCLYLLQLQIVHKVETELPFPYYPHIHPCPNMYWPIWWSSINVHQLQTSHTIIRLTKIVRQFSVFFSWFSHDFCQCTIIRPGVFKAWWARAVRPHTRNNNYSLAVSIPSPPRGIVKTISLMHLRYWLKNTLKVNW